MSKRLLSSLFSPKVKDKHTDELGQPAPLELHMTNLPLTPYSGKGDERSTLIGRGTPEFFNRSKGSGAHRLGDLRLVGRNAGAHRLGDLRLMGRNAGAHRLGDLRLVGRNNDDFFFFKDRD